MNLLEDNIVVYFMNIQEYVTDKFSNLILKIEVCERKKRNTYKKRKTKARSYNNWKDVRETISVSEFDKSYEPLFNVNLCKLESFSIELKLE